MRDEFIKAAMIALGPHVNDYESFAEFAEDCSDLADAMMRNRRLDQKGSSEGEQKKK